jgi:hypothetical protein
VSSLSQDQTPRDEVSIDSMLLLSYCRRTVLKFIPEFGKTRMLEGVRRLLNLYCT